MSIFDRAVLIQAEREKENIFYLHFETVDLIVNISF